MEDMTNKMSMRANLGEETSGLVTPGALSQFITTNVASESRGDDPEKIVSKQISQAEMFTPMIK